MEKSKQNYCVILAGGKGRRLWPSSREERPKQFIDFFGVGRTQLQATFDHSSISLVWAVRNCRQPSTVSLKLYLTRIYLYVRARSICHWLKSRCRRLTSATSWWNLSIAIPLPAWHGQTCVSSALTLMQISSLHRPTS